MLPKIPTVNVPCQGLAFTGLCGNKRVSSAWGRQVGLEAWSGRDAMCTTERLRNSD